MSILNWLKSFRIINWKLYQVFSTKAKVTTHTIPKEITEMERGSRRYPNHVFKLGDGVLVRGNEPNPLWVGHIIKFENFGRENQTPLPIVKNDADGKEYLCFAIIIPFSYQMMDNLNTMPPIEQYNYLAWDHCQLDEKYGVKYKTY